MNNKKIVSLKIENIFPFYIDNVNIKFFNSLNQIPNKKFVNKILPKIAKTLEGEELQKFIEIDNLTKFEKVSLMLNLALKKIVSKTGSYECDIFKVQNYDKFNEPMYIKNIERDKDIEIISQVEEQFLGKNENQIVPQVGEQFKMVCNKVFMIPWGHIKLLIDKCHDNTEKFNFYIDKIIENNWSRAVLLNFLDTDLFERLM